MVLRNSLIACALTVSTLCMSGCGTPPKQTQDAGLADPAHDPCTQPGDKGNSLRVGEYCTANDGVCEQNLSANPDDAFVCTLEQDPTAPLAMCTKACSWNGDCGENAICQGDPSQPTGPKGCVPSACDPGDPGVPNPPDAGTPSDGGADAG